MTKDFANRGRSDKPAKKRTRAAVKPRATRAAPTKGNRRTGFHGPSFSSGAIFGAIIVLLAAYLPEWMGSDPGNISKAEGKGPNTPAITFEFPDLLKDSEIQVDTAPYQGTPADSRGQPASFNVQAASFRDEDDANELRARLILLNLPANVTPNESETGMWHRVTLGPFERRVDANRALTKLREQGISGIILQ